MQIQSDIAEHISAAVIAQFEDAAPPEPPRGDRESLEIHEAFGELVRGFRFRESTGRRVEIRVSDHCLTPLIRDGDVLQVAPTLQAKDGDVVLVAYKPDAYRDLLEHPESIAYMREHATQLPPVMVKTLLEVGRDYTLCDREKGVYFESSKHRILGVVVGVQRQGRQRYGDDHGH